MVARAVVMLKFLVRCTTRDLKGNSLNLDIKEELWSQDLVTDGRTGGNCGLASLR